MNLTFNIKADGKTTIFSLNGKILADNDYNELEKNVLEVLNQGRPNIIFNLKDLKHINSSGIAFFMRTLNKARILNGELILCELSEGVKKIFEITKLDEIYSICSTESDGLKTIKEDES